MFQGFDRTAKQNFGGGNTAWEERKLSKYETRWDDASCPEQTTGQNDTSTGQTSRVCPVLQELISLRLSLDNRIECTM